MYAKKDPVDVAVKGLTVQNLVFRLLLCVIIVLCVSLGVELGNLVERTGATRVVRANSLPKQTLEVISKGLEAAEAFNAEAQPNETVEPIEEETAIAEQEGVPEIQVSIEPNEQKMYYSENDVQILAKLVYREARGCSKTEQSGVVWTVLNRVDSTLYPNSISVVVTSPSQFAWYPDTPVEPEIVNLCRDVLNRWNLEKNGFEISGRTLPKEYLYFTGDGVHNYFRIKEKKGSPWNWSLESPY